MRVLLPWKKSPSAHSDAYDSDQEPSSQGAEAVDTQPVHVLGPSIEGRDALVPTDTKSNSDALQRVTEPREVSENPKQVGQGSVEEQSTQETLPITSTKCQSNQRTNEFTASVSRPLQRQIDTGCKSSTSSSRNQSQASETPTVVTLNKASSSRTTNNSKKRPRSVILPDSKPAAKLTMTGGGGRPRIEDNKAEEHWESDPLENEPPPLQNTITIASSSNSVVQDPTEDRNQGDKESKQQQQQNELSPSELAFQEVLKQRGLEIVEQEGDGNCLFRAVSLQVYGDPSMHGEVRERCLDFMERDPEHFAPFVAMEDAEPASAGAAAVATAAENKSRFATYIARKRHLGVHGNNPEIQAISELFNRPVEVFTPEQGAEPLNIFQTAYKTSDVPIRLSYHDGNHYNAVVDPLVPTAGLGLGLPGLQPGLADKMQMAKAVAESDQLADEMELEHALKASRDDEYKRALKESSSLMDKVYNTQGFGQTDLDKANFELEQKVLANSLESYRRQEHGRKKRASPSNSRRRQPPSPVLPDVSADPATSVAAAAPSVSELSSMTPSPALAAAPPVASAASASAASPQARRPPSPPPLGTADEYPSTVQELVMNGFDLRKVVHAYELIGDNFDDLLAFLMSNNS